MPQFHLDTDHVTLYEHAHPLVRPRVDQQAPGAVVVCDVTVEESLRGRLAALARSLNGPQRVARYNLFRTTFLTLHRFPILPFDQTCEQQFQHLLGLRLHIGTQDLKIAAIALVHQVVLLTRNRSDFGRVPGLQLDDWSR